MEVGSMAVLSPGHLILLGLPWVLFRYGVAQHPEQAFPVGF